MYDQWTHMINDHVWSMVMHDQWSCMINGDVWSMIMYDHWSCMINDYAWSMIMCDQWSCARRPIGPHDSCMPYIDPIWINNDFIANRSKGCSPNPSTGFWTAGACQTQVNPSLFLDCVISQLSKASWHKTLQTRPCKSDVNPIKKRAFCECLKCLILRGISINFSTVPRQTP